MDIKLVMPGKTKTLLKHITLSANEIGKVVNKGKTALMYFSLLHPVLKLEMN